MKTSSVDVSRMVNPYFFFFGARDTDVEYEPVSPWRLKVLAAAFASVRVMAAPFDTGAST